MKEDDNNIVKIPNTFRYVSIKRTLWSSVSVTSGRVLYGFPHNSRAFFVR